MLRESDRAEDFLNLDDDDDNNDDETASEPSQTLGNAKEHFPTSSLSQKSAPITPERSLKSNIRDGGAQFRALPLLPHDLPYTQIRVSSASVRPNDRGKDVLSFSVYIRPGPNKDAWRVDKLYSDIIALDQRVRASVGKSVLRKIASLPEPKLWKDHAPVKVDQRKVCWKQVSNFPYSHVLRLLLKLIFRV
jgi:RalA-binding protein 1